jgi:hypothetical protein
VPSMVCLVPVIELLGQQYTKWCQVPCLCCLCLEIWSCSISLFSTWSQSRSGSGSWV